MQETRPDHRPLPKSFLKWAGGKSNLIKEIIPFVPKDYKRGCYFEPFLGSGAMFFHLQPPSAVLSDLNEHLIDCFVSIRNNPVGVYRYLHEHRKRNCETYYYEVRETYNTKNKAKITTSIAQAARFIYLNKACFNGLFRVNKRGEFNVPYGYRETLALPSTNQLRSMSRVLKKAKLIATTFEKVLEMAQRDDFIYLDPPYTVMHRNNGFIKYNSKLFAWGDQEKLCYLTNILTKKGVKVLISNAAHPSIEKLYKEYSIISITRTSCISANKESRIKVTEYLIKNY